MNIICNQTLVIASQLASRNITSRLVLTVVWLVYEIETSKLWIMVIDYGNRGQYYEKNEMVSESDVIKYLKSCLYNSPLSIVSVICKSLDYINGSTFRIEY